MLPGDLNSYLPTLTPLAIITLLASFYEIRKNQKQIAKERAEINQKIYETLILREIGERIGYELNIERLLETIITSLNKLVSFSTVSYVLEGPDPSKVLYRIHLEESVNRAFLNKTRDYLLRGLEQVSDKKYLPEALDEKISGSIIDEGDQKDIASLWIAPLTINNRGVGAIALSSIQKGLYHGPEMEVLTKILAQANRAVNQLEEVINTEQSKILSMISSMADGVMMLDNDNNLVAINPPASKMLGLEALGKVTILDVARALSDKLDLRSKIDESVRDKKIVTFDNLIIGNSYYKLLVSPATDKNGKNIGSVVIFHDMTAQKELERVRDDFTAMMVHELRAPLTVIRGTTDMFISQPNLATDSQGKELLSTMLTSTSTMLGLVNDLLDAAKIEAGKFQIIKTKGDLGAIIKDRVVFFQQMAEPKQIALATETATAPLEAEFDRDRMTQVFNNLLSNAIKFTAVGGKITIDAYKISQASEIKWRFSPPNNPPALPSQPNILISISDTGLGIPKEKISDLFSKFKQLGKNAEGTKGTGLGLVIAKGIIESHGGIIFVESEVNSGTTFHFTLPLTTSS